MPLFNKRIKGGLSKGKVVETNPSVRPDSALKAVKGYKENKTMMQTNHAEDPVKRAAAQQTFF
jgi:hypothetical protein